MKLTDEQIVVFKNTILDLQKQTMFFKTTDLYSLYKDRYFVTERFGNILSLCKKVKNSQGGGHFTNIFLYFKTPYEREFFDSMWQPIAEEQYRKYKGYLLGERKIP